MRPLLVAAVLLLSSAAVSFGYDEADYIEALANDGLFVTMDGSPAITEKQLPNGTRADIIGFHDDTLYAVEVEFASKWAESIGQAINYSLQTGGEPGVVLILEDAKDIRFVRRLLPVAERCDVKVWLYHRTEILPESP